MLNLLGVVDALTLTEISFHTTQTRLNKHLQAHELKENIKAFQNSTFKSIKHSDPASSKQLKLRTIYENIR